MNDHLKHGRRADPSYWTTTWTYKPFSFTKEQINSITEEASMWTKFKLLFKQSHYSFLDDGTGVIRYKLMGKTVYIMKRGTKI